MSTITLDRTRTRQATTGIYWADAESEDVIEEFEEIKEELKEPIYVEDDSVVFNPNFMELGKYYIKELGGEPYIYRKVSDHEVEIYGLAKAS